MNKRVLVIDDEESVRKMMHGILTKTGYDVYSAADGFEAIKKLESLSVDLIILDMNMPRMDGITFLKHIREGKTCPAPVLMVSGSTDPDLKVDCYKLGVYDFINKPEQIEVMLKRIENGLKIGDIINFNEFIKIELLMAQKLQTYLYPELTLSTENVEIQTVSRLLSDIGGDLFDYIEFRDGRIIFFVADIAGHSISGAMYTAIVKMVFRNAVRETDNPAGIMSIMNRELSGNIPIDSFVTMFCGLLDPTGLVLHYANAGHPAPFLLKGNDIIELKGSDALLGPIKNARFERYSHDISRGDSIFVYTDGIYDIKDPKTGLTGEEWMRIALNNPDLDIAKKIDNFRSTIMDSETEIIDDCTLMMVRIR